MKILHLSDLHIGKRLNEFSMLEDQAYLLAHILDAMDETPPDLLVIAGDVYDKSTPSAEAVAVLDEFLTQVAHRKITILLVSGNHDSPERIAFGARLMQSSGVYVSPVYTGPITPITMTDEYGEIDLYLLPFLKPSSVRPFVSPDLSILSYTDAIRSALVNVQPQRRNVLIAHQFVTGAERCDSEELAIGGCDGVDIAAFDAFDYVALGHLHTPQSVGRPSVRYCGTPLCYSFSEARTTKSLSWVTLGPKGQVTIETTPLVPRHELREWKGAYRQLMAETAPTAIGADDYLHITLTDENDIPDAMHRIRMRYPRVMKLDYDNQRTRKSAMLPHNEPEDRRSPLDVYAEFYQAQNNQPMTEAQRDYMMQLLTQVWEDNA